MSYAHDFSLGRNALEMLLLNEELRYFFINTVKH